MCSHDRRRRVVAADHQHIRLQRNEAGQELVTRLESLDLALEVTVLACGVGVLKVDEEKVVVVPRLAQRVDLVREG